MKATSYGENVVAARWAAERGCDEALFANTRGELCEGTGSNVFVVVDGVLRTPPLSSGCLAGVTRELVCELVDVDESPLPMDALAAADEAFLTSSTRDVHPVPPSTGGSCPRPGPRHRTRCRQRGGRWWPGRWTPDPGPGMGVR